MDNIEEYKRLYSKITNKKAKIQITIEKVLIMSKNSNSIKEIIRQWLYENYGKSELVNPAWNITELAKYIAKNII
jgi:hypothetical protein